LQWLDHNAATEPRSLGSTMKPALYLSAFRAGLNPSFVLPDVRMDLRAPGAIDPYFPVNYSRKYGEYGSAITMRTALQRSLNVPAVYTYNLVGKQNYVDTYTKLNGWEEINRQVQGPSAVLGAANMPLLEQVHAFSTFAAEGVYNPTRAILMVKDDNEKTVYDNRKLKSKQVIDKKYIYLINDMNKNYILFTWHPLLKRSVKKLILQGKPVLAILLLAHLAM
jgi:membrane peptidoglycan carboxypeptidase